MDPRLVQRADISFCIKCTWLSWTWATVKANSSFQWKKSSFHSQNALVQGPDQLHVCGSFVSLVFFLLLLFCFFTVPELEHWQSAPGVSSIFVQVGRSTFYTRQDRPRVGIKHKWSFWVGKMKPMQKHLKPALHVKATRWQKLWLQKDFWSYRCLGKQLSVFTSVNSFLLSFLTQN